MDEQEQDGSEVLETTEEAVEETEEETPEAKTARLETELAQAKKDKEEADLKNKQLFERAKKAEQQKKPDGLTGADALALVGAQVTNQEDVDAVLEWSKFKKISVQDALQEPVIKNILANNLEVRRTAEATHTSSSTRGTSKVSGEDLLQKAERTGEVPDTDEGMEDLIMARLQRKTTKQPQRRS